jgi:hypothetical protein
MNNLDNEAFLDWQSNQNAIAETPTNVYRECAIKMMRVMHLAIYHAMKSEVNAWGVMYATDHPFCRNQSMSACAQKLRVSRATISAAAVDFCKLSGLPPSAAMTRNDKPKTKK